METQSQIQQFYKQTTYNYIQYWMTYLQKYQADNTMLESEINNIFLAIQKAFTFNFVEEFIQVVHTIYSFCEGRGMYSSIKAHLVKAQPTIESLQRTDDIIKNLLYLGRVTMRQGSYSEAISYWKQGTILAQQCGNQAHLCDLEIELGVIETESQNYTDATQHLQRGLVLARELSLTNKQCVALGELCRLAYLQRNVAEAEVYCQEALQVAYQFNYTHSITGLLVYLGALDELNGNLAQAQEHWEQGLDLARTVGNLERISTLLTNLGMITTSRGDEKKAEMYLREGLDVARKLGQRQETSHILMDLGLLISSQGQKKEAEDYMEESITLARETQYPPLIIYNLLKRGEYYLEQSKWSAAVLDFHESLNSSKSSNKADIEKNARAYWGIAQVANANQSVTEAKEMAQKSLTLFEQIQHPLTNTVQNWLSQLSEISS